MRTMMSDNWLLTSMVGLVLLANLPQVILTFICFAYNIIFTAMLLFNEWISYVRERKRHRISQVCKRI